MPINFTAAERLPEGGVRFFLTFTRMEFALKDRGYLPDGMGRADVSWNRFADELGADFLQMARESGQANTLTGTAPPRKQMRNNGRLFGRDMERPTSVRELFEAVRRVRNNLVHGGKSGDPDASDPQRSRNFIVEAQWLLKQALERNNEVRAAFEGNA